MNYAVRIVANYTKGNNWSDGVRVYMPLDKPENVSAQTYLNAPIEKTGYVTLQWNTIPYADEYKIFLYNGKTYQYVGKSNANTWTSQNKGIWPTSAEIEAGGFNLHEAGGGVELSVDPSPVYNNAKGGYEGRKNYAFYITATSVQGFQESPKSGYVMPTFSEAVPFLGEEDYWSLIDVPYGSVNAATGNLVIDEEDVSISGRGPGLGVERTYNSLSSEVGLFGLGWHSDAEMKIVAKENEARYTDEDGTIHVFTKQADGKYKAPTGVYLDLEETTEEFILTSKDQTKYHFGKTDGKLSKIKDGQGNTTTYLYTNGQLKTIQDASQRTITISYNADGFIDTLTDPLNRTITFGYENDLLTTVTNAAGEITQYEYDQNNRLSKVYEPTHTAEKPVVNQFIYTNERVSEVTNPTNKRYLLDYDQANRQLTLTQPANRKVRYTFNEAANPIQIIEDVDGLKITTSNVYEGNNIKETKDPNDQDAATPTESYTYDANGNVLTASDSYGTESYEYNQNNDVTSITDTENDVTSIAYDGLNAVSETDQSGKVSSVAKYDQYGNLTESSDSLGSAANLLLNSSFEDGITSWKQMGYLDSGTISSDMIKEEEKDFVLGGTLLLKLNGDSSSSGSELGMIAATQELSAQPNTTYTLSGRVKTKLTKANAFFNVLFLDSQDRTISWADNRYSQLTGTMPWTERQLTFKTPANTAKIRIYLEVDHRDPNGLGEAWFDAVQLEKAEVSSSFNPLVNSSFENGLTQWTGSGGTQDSIGFDGGKSIKISRTSATQAASIYKQALTIGQSPTASPVTLTLTGLSKATDVKADASVNSTDYSIGAKVYYTDNTTEDFKSDFPTGTQEWNRGAVKIPASKPITKIDISLTFQGNYTGTVWFDAVRLLEGNIVTKDKYDGQGNYVIEEEDEEGNTSYKSYDSVGNLKDETDAKGAKKVYEYDLADQLKKLLLSNGTSIGYQYDKKGNMKSKSITASTVTQTFSYSYDAAGNLLDTTGPLGDITKNEYDDNGNQLKTVFPRGNFTEWAYDGTERVSGISYNGAPYYSFGYDKNGNETSVVYAKEGNRSKTRTYDPSNRLRTLIDRGGSQQWEYPAESDKLKTFTFTNGAFSQSNSYEYNQLDQNTVVKDGANTYRFDYDERGNVRTFTTGNGAGTTFTYNDRGLVDSLASGTAGGTGILSEKYSYDQNGNRTKIAYPDGTSVSYEYGDLDQLTKEVLRDGTVKEYAYVGFGNRKSVRVTKDGQTTSAAAEFNIANQLTQFGNESITYDANGNRLTDGKYKYDWNAADQLVAVTKLGETTPFVTYLYNEDGKRIQKNVNGTITNYHYDGDSLNVLYETDGQNNVVRSYTYSESGQLLSMRKGDQKYFYHYNAHGDVIALTDKTGQKVASYEYDSWGNVLKAEEAEQIKDNPYRYAGYQFDRETGMYYLIARYYQPEQGVFLSLDPDAGDEDDILTQNGYSYANNNPVNMIDPDGKKPFFSWARLKYATKYALNAWFASYVGWSGSQAIISGLASITDKVRQAVGAGLKQGKSVNRAMRDGFKKVMYGRSNRKIVQNAIRRQAWRLGAKATARLVTRVNFWYADLFILGGNFLYRYYIYGRK